MTDSPDTTAQDSGFVRRVVAAAPADRFGLCLDLVLTETAALLECPPSEVAPDRAYRDYGYNSLAGLALTEQLKQASGIDLPLTMLFDQPNPTAVAGYLLERIRTGAGLADSSETAGDPAPQEHPDVPGTGDEDIAVVGMACRYPGGVRSPLELWELVVQGRDAIGDFPGDRGWDLDALYHPDPAHPGTSSARHGGFLSGVADFDPQFFGISPHDAVAIDPQQRLLLEGTWELCEHAGIDPATLRGDTVGVFLGVCGSDYSYLTRPPAAGLEGRWGLGMMSSVASGRVAYTFGLTGPALTVDTACSSSLVAVHLAMQSLRRGESSMAIAGGVQVLATPSLFIEFSRQRGLAPDGRCKSFADAADGTGFSEGMGLVLLERVGDARRNGHEIYAVLRGSAVNSDGASNGLTAPNGPAQERVIGAALADGGLTAADVDAVEAHGTGTTLGDPIEANAVLATYGHGRPADRPLWLGSIKSNIGHTQGAAGASGLIKTIMALRHNTLPRTLHVDAPSRTVDWSTGGVALLTEPQPWPPDPGGRVRRAGISGFGVSGTNAHLIVEEPPADDRPTPSAPDRDGDTPLLWVLSARTPGALSAQARQLHERLTAHPDHPLDVAHSLATTRAHLEHRAVVIGSGDSELRAGLEAVAGGRAGGSVTTGRIRLDGRSAAALMFPGQGSQYPGMGSELAHRYPVYATTYRQVCAELDRHLDRPIETIIDGTARDRDPDLLDRTGYTQAALFAVEVALYRLLESFGVRPAYLIGHSIGELAAAHVSDVLDLPDACRLVATRARLMQALPPGGAMVAVEATEEEITPDLTGSGGRVALAAVNGPAAVVLSGAHDEVDAVAERWAGQGRRTKRLAVSHAFHSPLTEPMLAEFADVARTITPGAPRIPVVSNLTGTPCDDFGTADYWVRHVRDTVRFADGIGWLADAGIDTFLEAGPGGALSVAARECLAEADHPALVVPTLRPRRPEAVTLLTALSRAHVGGLPVDVAATLPAGGQRIALPTYPFEHRRFWAAPEPAASAAPGVVPAGHPLFDGSLELPDSADRVFLGRWSVAGQPWLAEHTVFGSTVVAGAAVVELAAHLGGLTGFPTVTELTAETPLLIPPDRTVSVQVRIAALDRARRSLTVHTDGGDGWRRHASAILSAEPVAAQRGTSEPPADAEEIDITGLYARLAGNGLGYGPRFQRLRAAWRHGDDIYARIDPGPADEFLIHPGTLDAAFHAAFLSRSDDDSAWLPFVWSGARIRPGTPASLLVRLSAAGPGTVAMTAVDESGEVVAAVDAVLARPVSLAHLAAARAGTDEALYRWSWNEIAATAASSGPSFVTLGTAANGEPRYRDLAALLPDIEAGTAAPDLVLVDPAERFPSFAESADVPGETAAISRHALDLVRQWLSHTATAAARLVFVTRGAVRARDDEAPDPRAAAVWGLVRSAQNEHPDRFALADIGNHDDIGAAAHAAGSGISQLAVRAGTVLVPRLRPMRVPAEPPPWRGLDGTALITGGTSGLGALIAEHLVAQGVRRLTLVSRRGPRAEGIAGLVAELTRQGAEIDVVACDVSDRAQAAELIEKIRAHDRLRVIVHAAGVLDDGVVEELTEQRLDRVLRPKVDAAWHLHELTADLDLAAFVVFSSAAGVLGAPGQANYAAANAFLDALAARRRRQGLPAVSMAWGLWAQDGGMTGQLGTPQKARLTASGVLAFDPPDGLRLFDATATATEPAVIPLRLDPDALRRAPIPVPPVLSDLVPDAPAAPETGALHRRLTECSRAERLSEILRLVCTEVAAVLRYPSPDAVDPERAFTDLGFDSLAAVELRNRLTFEAGVTIPATVVFDHPTPEAIAQYLDERLFATPEPEPEPAGPAPADELDSMDAETLVRMALSDE
ncbi:type I polyketide synthase [Nocardia sp. BMG51109]|uniref:type I polyketide synthase n=1 Tax=Nocardia sp. BMG51109 TaxID=1056816 RepID=UPI000462EACB|nr:type I polyketide synthase [Nocardia sp. BMG51109]